MAIAHDHGERFYFYVLFEVSANVNFITLTIADIWVHETNGHNKLLKRVKRGDH